MNKVIPAAIGISNVQGKDIKFVKTYLGGLQIASQGFLTRDITSDDNIWSFKYNLNGAEKKWMLMDVKQPSDKDLAIVVGKEDFGEKNFSFQGDLFTESKIVPGSSQFKSRSIINDYLFKDVDENQKNGVVYRLKAKLKQNILVNDDNGEHLCQRNIVMFNLNKATTAENWEMFLYVVLIHKETGDIEGMAAYELNCLEKQQGKSLEGVDNESQASLSSLQSQSEQHSFFMRQVEFYPGVVDTLFGGYNCKQIPQTSPIAAVSRMWKGQLNVIPNNVASFFFAANLTLSFPITLQWQRPATEKYRSPAVAATYRAGVLMGFAYTFAGEDQDESSAKFAEFFDGMKVRPIGEWDEEMTAFQGKLNDLPFYMELQAIRQNEISKEQREFFAKPAPILFVNDKRRALLEKMGMMKKFDKYAASTVNVQCQKRPRNQEEDDDEDDSVQVVEQSGVVNKRQKIILNDDEEEKKGGGDQEEEEEEEEDEVDEIMNDNLINNEDMAAALADAPMSAQEEHIDSLESKKKPPVADAAPADDAANDSDASKKEIEEFVSQKRLREMESQRLEEEKKQKRREAQRRNRERKKLEEQAALRLKELERKDFLEKQDKEVKQLRASLEKKGKTVPRIASQKELAEAAQRKLMEQRDEYLPKEPQPQQKKRVPKKK